AEDRVPERVEVRADLVRPPRLDRDLEERRARQALLDHEVSDRGLAALVGLDLLAAALARRLGEGSVDRAALLLDSAARERRVGALDAALLQVLEPGPRRRAAQRAEEEARRVAVEPPDRDALLAAESGVEGLAEAALVAAPRVDDDAVRLRGDDDIVVPEADARARAGNELGGHARPLARSEPGELERRVRDRDDHARVEPRVRLGALAAEADPA